MPRTCEFKTVRVSREAHRAASRVLARVRADGWWIVGESRRDSADLGTVIEVAVARLEAALRERQ